MSKYKITIIRTGTALNPLKKKVKLLVGGNDSFINKHVKDGGSFEYDESKGMLYPIAAAKYMLEDMGATIKVEDAD